MISITYQPYYLADMSKKNGATTHQARLHCCIERTTPKVLLLHQLAPSTMNGLNLRMRSIIPPTVDMVATSTNHFSFRIDYDGSYRIRSISMGFFCFFNGRFHTINNCHLIWEPSALFHLL